MVTDVEIIWSEEQKAIFEWFENSNPGNNLVVRARAGTGKTRTIQEAFYRVKGEFQLLYAVFNKKNQNEAAEKITDPRVQVSTLHSLGYKFIRHVWPGARPDYDIERERIELCGKLPPPPEVVVQILRLVGIIKNITVKLPDVNFVATVADDCGIYVSDELEAAGWTSRGLATVAVRALKRALEPDAQGRISFDDMVWLPVAKGWVRPLYDMVVIDEAQDMNKPQLLMARQACKQSGRICVVGDDRQAIYGFRGADSGSLTRMTRELDAPVFGLTVTYRCPKAVVELAREYVPDYTAAASAPEGLVVINEDPEVILNNLTVGDAVLSRINAPLMGIALRLLRRGVPARIEGKDIGRQLIGMVRKLRARSVPDFLRKLTAWEDREILRLVARNSRGTAGKVDQIRDQAATLTAVAEGAASIAEITRRIDDLFSDTREGQLPAVVCSSVHKAKGLEWDRVTLLSDTFRARVGIEDEEANIYYVAITRAKQQLTLL